MKVIDGRKLILRFVIFIVVGTQIGALASVPYVVASDSGTGLLVRDLLQLPVLAAYLGFIPAVVSGATMPRGGSPRVSVWLLGVAIVTLVVCGLLAFLISWLFGILVVTGGLLAALICRFICIRLGIDDWHMRTEVTIAPGSLT